MTLIFLQHAPQLHAPICKTKADKTDNPCLSGAGSQNSKIATTAVASPSLSDAVLARFRRSPLQCSRMAGVTRKVGHSTATAGSRRALAGVCLLCERARWKAVAIGRAGPSFLTPKLTSDTHTFAPFISSLHQEVVKDKQEQINQLLSIQLLIPPHTTANMVKAGMYTSGFFTLSLDDVDAGVRGMSTFEADAEAGLSYVWPLGVVTGGWAGDTSTLWSCH